MNISDISNEELRTNLDYLIKTFPYSFKKILPADILHDIGRHIIININRARFFLEYEHYSNSSFHPKYRINQRIEWIYNFAKANRDKDDMLKKVVSLVFEETNSSQRKLVNLL